MAGIGLVALFLSVSNFAVLAAEDENGPFPDVESDHGNITAIQFMKDNEVFTGYPDGTYQPDRVLNRAEQLKVYMLLHGIDPDEEEYKDCFPDVGDDWFAKYVCYAEEQGWVEGYPDGYFRPAQEVNKVEALKMLGEIQGWAMQDPTEPSYEDTPVEEWYAKYVDFAKSAGLLEEEGATFAPADGLTRGSTAEVLFRSLAVYELEEGAYSEELEEEILAIDVQNIMPPTPVQPIVGVAPLAEYGDAPETGFAGYSASYVNVEAKFPTLFNTVNSLYGPGAHALDSGEEWLGDPAFGGLYSYENDADDPADGDGVMNLVDSDAHDDGVVGLNVNLISIPPPAVLTVDVTVNDGAPDVPRYLNVVIDLNMDGKWNGDAAGGEPEWVVQNFVVNVDPGTTERITTDEFAYSNGMILTPFTWMRVLLSRDPIDASVYRSSGWDGSGEFEHGEVEDYFVELPPVDGDGENGGGGGVIWGKPAPVMVCPPKVKFPDGVDVVSFRCWIGNYGGAGGANYALTKLSGGVDVILKNNNVTLATAPPGLPPWGVVGNPIFERFWAFRGDLPSTWEYKIEGEDPESYVENGIVKLGLVAQEKEEGYEGGDFDEFETWASVVDDAYLFDEDAEGPVITDVVMFEMDASEVDEDYHYKFLAECRDTNAGSFHTYDWSSPAQCGMLSSDGNMLDWKFDLADAYDCMTSGLELTVSDGVNSVTELFDGLFIEIPEPVVVDEAPVVEYIYSLWMNEMEDDPHIYKLTVYADDPEGGELTYNWTSVTCGELTADADQQMVEWQYVVADMEACGAAEVTVEISDGVNVVEHTQSIF